MTKIKSIFDRERKEVEELLGIWKDSSRNPFVLKLYELISFSEKIKIAVKIIDTSDNPRLIVLETWLIIDFTIRYLLNHGLELYRYETRELSFLPINTRDCINMLQELIKEQSKKMPNRMEKTVKLPSGFFEIIYNDEVFFKKFLEYEDQYYKKYIPDYYNLSIEEMFNDRDSKYRNVNEHWFNEVSKLSIEWFEAVKKINKVRNYAAHSFDENQIYLSLGINGRNKISNLKKYCKETLSELLGIK